MVVRESWRRPVFENGTQLSVQSIADQSWISLSLIVLGKASTRRNTIAYYERLEAFERANQYLDRECPSRSYFMF